MKKIFLAASLFCFTESCKQRKQSQVLEKQEADTEDVSDFDPSYKKKDKEAKKAFAAVTKEERIAYIKNAKVWKQPDFQKVTKKQLLPKKLSKLDLTRPLECNFYNPEGSDDAPGGLSPKFLCNVQRPNKPEEFFTLKFKYGPTTENAEFQFEPMTGSAASDIQRLFGFFGDNETPVEVTCKDCPSDPWTTTLAARSGKRDTSFTPQKKTYKYASMEVKPPMYPINALQTSIWCKVTDKLGMSQCEGWGFKELFAHLPDDENEALEEAIHREGLVILMALLQHTDNKPGNQRLGCFFDQTKKDEATGKYTCKEPTLMVQDAGRIFGSGRFEIKGVTKPSKFLGIFPDLKIEGAVGTFSAVDYEAWKNVAVFRDKTGGNECKLQAGASVTGSLPNIQVSKKGIEFFLEMVDKNPNFKTHLTNIFEKNGFGVVHTRIKEHLAAGGKVLTSEKEYLTKTDIPAATWAETFMEKVKTLRARATAGKCKNSPLDIDIQQRADFLKGFLALGWDTKTNAEVKEAQDEPRVLSTNEMNALEQLQKQSGMSSDDTEPNPFPWGVDE